MSTRCNIIIEDQNQKITLYHHHDGYPEGVGLYLYNNIGEKIKTGYWRATDVANMLIKSKDDDEYELTTGLHGDIEFLYTIDLMTRKITCQAVDNWDEFTITKTIDLAKVQPRKAIKE